MAASKIAASAETQRGHNSPSVIEGRITELRRQIDELAANLTSAQKSQADLLQERDSLLVAARSNRDLVAQERLQAIDTEVSRVTRDAADDAIALAKLKLALDDEVQLLE